MTKRTSRPFVAGHQVDEMLDEQEKRSLNILQNTVRRVATNVSVAIVNFLRPDTSEADRARLEAIDELSRRGHSQATFVPSETQARPGKKPFEPPPWSMRDK